MTAPAPARAQRTDLSPECRLDEHGHCSGPRVDVWPLGGFATRPVFTMTCACTCHRGGRS